MGWKENHPVITNKKKRGSEITESRFFLFVYGLAAKVPCRSKGPYRSSSVQPF